MVEVAGSSRAQRDHIGAYDDSPEGGGAERGIICLVLLTGPKGLLSLYLLFAA